MAVVLLGALYWLLYRTRFGRDLRATTQNPTAARMVGIDVNRISAFTLGIGVSLAAAGGMVFGSTNSFDAASSSTSSPGCWPSSSSAGSAASAGRWWPPS